MGCQNVMPEMEDGGSVIITSSVAGLKGFKGLGAYVASKHGIVGIMRVAALEFADRMIRVNSVHPGPVNNRMMRSIEKDMSPDDPTEVQKVLRQQFPLNAMPNQVKLVNWCYSWLLMKANILPEQPR